MNSLIHEFTMLARDGDGHVYRARCYGRERRDGTWIGWLEFMPRGEGGLVRETPRETTQPNRLALRYWALGLDEVYLDGALVRSHISSLEESQPTEA
ncbi:MAG: hypothetical protein E6I57_11950 [Chloroflexi bacterium]|nr:MAG: hypothetical protein E6J49_04935 [Chloroflexota bacterium]TMC28388.1 MAG: hypothetical protein E6J27_08765 [Chloroflexota bacterium]TMC34464.1 MAG: hypothetical protein E6J24_06365 [Chloroflexota bacterium]TMC59121.1 MAG: hypothetical protein E6J19_00705 [Chloroflexota bacterium]TME37237.1 MAG: hypothetical protein E6I57_11950 [Chloroflexota bacterium]